MRHPAVPPALGLITGVAVGWQRPELGAVPLVVLVTTAWLCAVVIGARMMTRLVTPVTMTAFFLAGALLGAQATRDATRTPLWRWCEQRPADMTRRGPVVVEGRLLRDATPTRYGASLTLAVHAVRTVEGLRRVHGGARVAVGGQLTSSRIGGWVEGRHLRMPVTFRESARYLNPGVPDQHRMSMWGGTSLLGSVKSALLVDVVDAGGWWSETAARARARVRERVDRSVGRFDQRSAGVVTAVLIGDRAGLAPDDRRRLQEGGTYHVIAISGGNIAILSGALILVFRVWGCGRRATSVATVGCLVTYAAIVGSEAP